MDGDEGYEDEFNKKTSIELKLKGCDAGKGGLAWPCCLTKMAVMAKKDWNREDCGLSRAMLQALLQKDALDI